MTEELSDKIVVWNDGRITSVVDESLIPIGKDPQVFDLVTGMNRPDTHVDGIESE